jgi:nicotinamide mononucleotide transporter
MQEIWNSFVQGLLQTSWLEAIAVVAGIASVVYSRKENILVYPVGLINTIIYIYISIKGQLFGEATVNLYYTIMSIYGWILWLKKDEQQHIILHVSFSDKKLWLLQLGFFLLCYIVIYSALNYLQQEFAPGAIPSADAFASASAFTGMWLMARKKVESWWWWIATNIASIPLYFVKGYVFTSVYYFILLILAILGLIEWTRRARISKLAN